VVCTRKVAWAAVSELSCGKGLAARACVEALPLAGVRRTAEGIVPKVLANVMVKSTSFATVEAPVMSVTTPAMSVPEMMTVRPVPHYRGRQEDDAQADAAEDLEPVAVPDPGEAGVVG
jgi:hypothetical protein